MPAARLTGCAGAATAQVASLEMLLHQRDTELTQLQHALEERGLQLEAGE